MARYKEYSYKQTKLIPISFDHQILPGTFEYTLNYLIDNEFDLSLFEQRYCNDETGAPAYDPAVLLKIILYAYSRGIVFSRQIEQCCRQNIIFMALSADTQPHFTTIADFISSSSEEIIELFRDVLLICDEMGLIGREMFAIDGCKMPSNASKEWSGTKAELKKKQKKMERAVRYLVEKHREIDAKAEADPAVEREQRQIETLREKVRKLKSWLKENGEKIGKSGKPRKSNLTDNESAKMKSAHGVIQGYDGVAAVDSKHQVVVHAEVFGQPQEHELLGPMIEGARENFQAIGVKRDVFAQAKLTADAGFHTEQNMRMLFEQHIDGYVADILFRKRDPRFVTAERHRARAKAERQKERGKDHYRPSDFIYDEASQTCICPAGNKLYRNGCNVQIRGFGFVKFRGAKMHCVPCPERAKCLRHPERTLTRQVVFFTGRSSQAPETFTAKMKRKIDSLKGRYIYSRRLGTVEPVFANITRTLGLNRFTLRGKRKVNGQWLLYCVVHNLLKIHRYAPGFA
ncbi:MAG: IS1182 family transposase [Deltaproteobacteria bacterium]|nr:IS1182 family transposase [Deltaproteobacteria bacterium]